MQDDAGYLGPISAVPLGIEQAQIGHEMRLVINGDVGTIRRFVIDIGIKFGPHPHIGRPPFHLDFWTPARTGSAGRTGRTASQSGPPEGLAKHSFRPSMTSIMHRLRLYPGVAEAAGTHDDVFYGTAHYLDHRFHEASLLPGIHLASDRYGADL